MIDPDAALSFLGFVEARHQVWERRQAGSPQPWTSDPIIASRKFTNVFRVLDYGSQFLIRELLEPDVSGADLLMRCFLYRHTGRPEVWEYLELSLGRYPMIEDLDDVLEAWKEYRGTGVTTKKPPRRPGQTGPGNGNQSTSFDRPVFTGAYLVFPQSQVAGTDKLESIVRLTQRLFKEGLATDFMLADGQAERFAVLRRNKGVADFMSQQIVTDWGYVGAGNEDEAVVPGPGARKGAAHLDSTVKAEKVLEWAVQAIRSSPGCPQLELPSGRLRSPSSMDAQNCLCEFSKYVRYEGKDHPKPYTPAHPGPQKITLPAHW